MSLVSRWWLYFFACRLYYDPFGWAMPYVFYVLMLMVLVGCNQSQPPTPTDTANPAHTQAQTVSGQQLYQKQCRLCHDSGLLNAPTLSDKADWQQRRQAGIETLYQHAIHGYNKMPAQVSGNVSADEVKAAVDYMLSAL